MGEGGRQAGVTMERMLTERTAIKKKEKKDPQSFPVSMNPAMVAVRRLQQASTLAQKLLAC